MMLVTRCILEEMIFFDRLRYPEIPQLVVIIGKAVFKYRIPNISQARAGYIARRQQEFRLVVLEKLSNQRVAEGNEGGMWGQVHEASAGMNDGIGFGNIKSVEMVNLIDFNCRNLTELCHR